MALFDTYVAALQHGTVDLPDDVVAIGVVLRPTRWFHPYVDENYTPLGPPEALLDDFQARRDALAADRAAAVAHNAAWEAVNYNRRYLDYIKRSQAAKDALAEIRERLADGIDVALVCYENTAEKRCHRTLLRDRLSDATD